MATKPAKLQTLKPKLQVLDTRRVPTLDTKAGATQRVRGRKWMTQRQRIQMRDACTCAGCGLVRIDHEVDHIVPLEQGGSNDDSNLQLLCSGPDGCHAKKTAREARARAGR